MAVTPNKSASMPWDQVRKVCLDYTIHGLEELSQAPRKDTSKPLTFVYVSGANAERDPAKKPWLLGEYSVMRVSSCPPCVLVFPFGNLELHEISMIRN